ncbi:NADPH-adrenodoxin reductase [Arachnomyces sp. PD_36]|nr:NADPH-adrenodoxin reductase [Arachnomyces sp. PD_36]
MNAPRIPYICARCTSNIHKTARLGRFKAVSSPFRTYSSNVPKSDRPFRVAVIGSGPAGFYAAYRLMSKVEGSIVDMYEQLPVPFGLVRFGVAPDHPEVKNCEDKFTEVASSPRFNFIGNVELGSALPLSTLKPHYDAILFSYGASKDKELGLPGEDAPSGVYSARAFVGWYNGLPEYRDLNPDLTAGEDAVIIGQGNVALDVARTLLTDVDVLRKTDMSEYALEALAKSKIRNVRVVGRRGPMQAAFTIKEVRELLQLPSVSFAPIPKDLLPSESVIASLPRAKKRIVQLLAKGSTTNPQEATKSWSLDFLLSPQSLHQSKTQPNTLSHVTFTKNQLDQSDPFSPSANVTSLPNSQIDIPASACFRSIGYKSLPLPGLEEFGVQFDHRRGTIPNDGLGRIIDPGKAQDTASNGATTLPGLYCAGWVKRGPTGVIASTMTDAFATADAIADDWAENMSSSGQRPFLNVAEGGSTGLGLDGVLPEARGRGLRPTSWQDWERIDQAEKERGKSVGKVREKFGTVEEMMEVVS